MLGSGKRAGGQGLALWQGEGPERIQMQYQPDSVGSRASCQGAGRGGMAPGTGTSSSTHHPTLVHPQEGMFLAVGAPLLLEGCTPLPHHHWKQGRVVTKLGYSMFALHPPHVMGRVAW